MFGEEKLAASGEAALLLDFYGELLSPRARDLLTLYYGEDLSLSEAAAQIGITRQGASDILRRALARLRSYERKLGLAARYAAAREALANLASRARALAADPPAPPDLPAALTAIANLAEGIEL